MGIGIPCLGRRRGLDLLFLNACLIAVQGCQIAPAVSTKRLLTLQSQSLLNFNGLQPLRTIDRLKVSIAPPRGWDLIETKKSALYTHEQWRSPSHANAVGVAYVRMPLPFTAKMLAWLAKREYANRGDDGKILNEWTDSLNRPWFEAENKLYHVRGYVLVHGLDAWIIYSGYKLTMPQRADEITMAAWSMETIVPIDSQEPAPSQTARAN